MRGHREALGASNDNQAQNQKIDGGHLQLNFCHQEDEKSCRAAQPNRAP